MRPSGGLFISFEGIEGVGKTTQIRLLAAWLEARGISPTLLREPGGTRLSEQIRELLLRSERGSVDDWAELCLYEAARAQVVREVIAPALAAARVVIADRFTDASTAYQGGGRRLGVARVRALNRLVTQGIAPDRTYLLDLDPRIGLDRIRTGRLGAGLDRLESESLSFHRRVRKTYLRLAAAEPDRFCVLDAAGLTDGIAAAVQRDLEPIL